MHCVIIVYCRSWNNLDARLLPRVPSLQYIDAYNRSLQLRSPLRRDSHRCAGSPRRGASRPPLDRRHNLAGRDEQPSVAAVEHLLPRGAAFRQAKPGHRPRAMGTHVRAWVSVDAVSGCGRRTRARRWGVHTSQRAAAMRGFSASDVFTSRSRVPLCARKRAKAPNGDAGWWGAG